METKNFYKNYKGDLSLKGKNAELYEYFKSKDSRNVKDVQVLFKQVKDNGPLWNAMNFMRKFGLGVLASSGLVLGGAFALESSDPYMAVTIAELSTVLAYMGAGYAALGGVVEKVVNNSNKNKINEANKILNDRANNKFKPNDFDEILLSRYGYSMNEMYYDCYHFENKENINSESKGEIRLNEIVDDYEATK